MSSAAPHPSAAAPAASLAALATLTACTGGGSSDGTITISSNPPGGATGTAVEASRLLAQASMGPNRADITRVQQLGAAGWIEEQFALPRQMVLYDWMIDQGFTSAGDRSVTGTDRAVWRSLITSADTLRQRVALALSEILVLNFEQSSPWRNFAAAAYFDLLLDNAFGNFRTLLEKVSTNELMGQFLTFIKNRKADPTRGTLPDENYAREILQLFSIGLYQLNVDGTVKLSNGKPIETYGQADILGLARVFTGWVMNGDGTSPEHVRLPMKMNAAWHETGAKTFLGTTIPAGTDGVASLKLALDAIFAHPNVGPFIGKQLIQRLVTSNPSAAYVARVTQAFNNNGQGVRGDMKAVIRAILLDPEARTLPTASTAGKLREPLLRFIGWARAFDATSPADAWNFASTEDSATKLGQQALHAPSVFNFFRPGYTPPNTALSAKAQVAPEFQITDEVSIAGYLNYMRDVVRNGKPEIQADYDSLLPLVSDAPALVAEVNLVLAAGQLSAASQTVIANAVASLPASTAADKQRRIAAAVFLTLASPEYIVLK